MNLQRDSIESPFTYMYVINTTHYSYRAINGKRQEEERYDENDKGLVFEPTGLSEPITDYTPKPYGTTGSEADETLLRNLQRQTTAKEVQYNDKVAELTKLQNVLKDLNKELTLIDDQITLLTSSTASTTVLSSPAAAKSATLHYLEREKADLKEKILDIETYTDTSLSPEISNLASELAILKKDYATKQQENTDKTRDIRDKQREITSKGTEIVTQ